MIQNLQVDRDDLTIDIQPTPEEQRVLTALEDPTCRTILRLLTEPTTPVAVVAQSDIPTSTVYRKLNAMTETALVEQSTRGHPGRGHTDVYWRGINKVTIDLRGKEECQK